MKFDYDQTSTDEEIKEAAEYLAELVEFPMSLTIPLMLGEDFVNAILAYRDQSEGKKLNLRSALRKDVDRLTEILADYSRAVDGDVEVEEAVEEALTGFPTHEDQVKEQLSPVLDVLADMGVPEDALDKAVKLTVMVTETLTDLVGDEELAVEVYDQLDPMYAPFAILAYRKQAEGHEFAEGELEPEVRKEVDRLTEILAQLSREEEAYEDDWREFPDYDLPPEVKDRINRLAELLEDAMGIAEAEKFDHYEDYRVNAKQWPSEDHEDQDSEDLDEVAYERHQEDIVRAARKNGGYVLATREVWAKPVAKTDDDRWVFETEYGLEYLDFEDYEFEPEFEDEESLVDFD